MVLKKLAKHAAKAFGLDVVRLSHAPRHTLLGIRSWPIRTVIDVGANTGQFARYIRGMFPEARLYCFEPLPGPYLELRSWAEQCGQNAVITFNTALGDREGTTEMLFHVDHRPASSILPSTDLCVESYPLTGR